MTKPKAQLSRVKPEHGNRARYVSRSEPCRCTKCRAANTAYMARYRAGGVAPRPSGQQQFGDQ